MKTLKATKSDTVKKKKEVSSSSPLKVKDTRILLTETFTLEPSAKMIGEGISSFSLDDNSPLVVKGIIQRCNTLNQNGRVYPRDVLVPKVEAYIKSKVNQGTAYGGLDHKDSEILEWEDVAFRFTKLWFEDDVLLGEAVFIPGTKAEKIIRGALKTGGKVGISSRAMGSVQRQTLPEGIVADVVQDDLAIICWDIVTEPSTPKAFMEPVEFKQQTSDMPSQRKSTQQLTSLMNENISEKKLESELDNLITMAKQLIGKNKNG
jgi:hypothetical protein